jgi:hypothetical protein
MGNRHFTPTNIPNAGSTHHTRGINPKTQWWLSTLLIIRHVWVGERHRSSRRVNSQSPVCACTYLRTLIRCRFLHHSSLTHSYAHASLIRTKRHRSSIRVKASPPSVRSAALYDLTSFDSVFSQFRIFVLSTPVP